MPIHLPDFDSVLEFRCPECSRKVFRFRTRPRDMTDFVGAVCVSCSHIVTMKDLETHTRRLAGKLH